MKQATTLTRGASASERPAAGAAIAGLVSSKTSGLLSQISFDANQVSHISFDPNQCALRRIKRLKKSVWASGHLHAMVDHGMLAPVCWFVTLTYAGVDDWRPNHIADSVRAFRRWCKSAKVACRYTWVGELQKRGAVHYHLLAWLPAGVQMPKWDVPGSRRDAFWTHGFTNTEKARAGVGYLMKYLSKLGEFHRFPRGMRLYGIGGLCRSGRGVRCWLNLPEWAKRSYGVGQLVRRAGRLVVSDTGDILSTPYRVSIMPGYLSVRLVSKLPERFHSGPYSALKH